MADVSDTLALRVEWIDAPGVTTPELAATWARYELWVGPQCVTQVESLDGTYRRSVYGSLYPLAEWITQNWWSLVAGMRPSAVSTRHWDWWNLRRQPWLRFHNLRGAGDGMAWPNLTVVPEGATTCLRWTSDTQHGSGRVRFAADGQRFMASTDVATGLAHIVEVVLDRLAETDVGKTGLSLDWHDLGRLDSEEQDFCTTAARLGLDPYTMPEQVEDQLVRAATDLSDDIRDDFFDSADPSRLDQALLWTQRADELAASRAESAQYPLDQLRRIVTGSNDRSRGRAWDVGYEMARQVRSELGTHADARFEVADWMASGELTDESGGILGVANIRSDRCGLVLSSVYGSADSRRFAEARTLGRTLVSPGQTSFVLSPSGRREERIARAFAAELLAPAAGISDLLDRIGTQDDVALDEIASRFGVSATVVRHQFENQVAGG